MDEFHVATQEFFEVGLKVSADEYLRARRRRYLYVRTMDQLLGADGLLLTPTVASAGWLADGRLHVNSAIHGLPPHVTDGRAERDWTSGAHVARGIVADGTSHWAYRSPALIFMTTDCLTSRAHLKRRTRGPARLRATANWMKLF